MKGQLLAAMVEGVSTRKDKTYKIILGTQEMNPINAGQLFTLMNQVVSVYICPSTIDSKEVEQVDKIDPEFSGKSQSKRIRDVLYVWFSQGNQGYKDFDSFYKHHTERFIEEIKNNLI